MNKSDIALMIILISLLCCVITFCVLSCERNKETVDNIKLETIESVKDSLAKAIAIKDSNIVKFTIQYNEEKQKTVELSDSAAIELFRQLCNE